MIRTEFFFRGSIAAAFIILFLLFPMSVFGVDYKISTVTDLPGIKEAQKDACEDRDTCVGWHYCQVSAQLKDGQKRAYNWVAYNEFYDLPIFDIAIDSGALVPNSRMKVVFNCNTTDCGFTGEISPRNWYLGAQVQPEDLFSGSCRYEEPFCCCTLKNGRLDDCQRAVDYGTGATPNAQCNFQTADVYKPFTAKAYPQYSSVINKGGGCDAFQDAVNKAQTAKDLGEQQKAEQSTINIKQEASILNQSRFTSAEQVIGQIIKLLISFIGSIALALYIGAGVLWMTSLGNSERIEKAKNIFVWTTLGVIVMLASYFIVQFVFTTLNV